MNFLGSGGRTDSSIEDNILWLNRSNDINVWVEIGRMLDTRQNPGVSVVSYKGNYYQT